MKTVITTARFALVLGTLAYCSFDPTPALVAQTTPSGSTAPTAAAAAPAGITNGMLPIQSTILAYKALVADANKIDESISSRTSGKIVVIGTSADIAAIVQLRIILGQEGILQRRLQTLTSTFVQIPKPVYAHTVVKGNVKLGAGFLASPADVATLIQTLGSITAVNQTISSASGALNDTTLISVVAPGIKSESVYVPSSYPVNLMTSTGLSDTFIGEALIELESARGAAITASNAYLQALQDAQIVATTVKGGALYSDAEIDTAGAFVEKAATITALVNAETIACTAVDGFETSLFTGQGYAPASANPASGGSGSTPVPAPVAAAAPALPAAVPAPPLPAPPTGSAPATPTPQVPSQGQQPATSSGTTLQQILSADLLLHKIHSKPTDMSKLQLLAVHALESGGGQLTKSNLFLGSRIYFGGGAVASFALYDATGTLECSGVGYAYNGNIREKSVQAAVESATPAVAYVSTTCK